MATASLQIPSNDITDTIALLFCSQWEASAPVKCPWSLADTWHVTPLREIILMLPVPALWYLVFWFRKSFDEPRFGSLRAGWRICGLSESHKPQEEKLNLRLNRGHHDAFTRHYIFGKSKDRKTSGCSSCSPPQWTIWAVTNISTFKLSFVSFFTLWNFGS